MPTFGYFFLKGIAILTTTYRFQELQWLVTPNIINKYF